MRYLLLDTNIWVRVISQGRPGCEVALIDELRNLIEQDAVVLLLPEVIELELEKNWRSFESEVEVSFGKLEKEVDALIKKNFWNEIEDVQKSLSPYLAEQKKKKLADAKQRFEIVNQLLASPKVKKLPFTEEIYFRGKKRLISGRMPKTENIAHSDACIIESLAEFFSDADPTSQDDFCFCSENAGDFALEAKDGHIIHPLIKDELPAATVYCIALVQVTEFFRKNERAVAPSQTVISEAVERRIQDTVQAQLEDEGNVEFCAHDGCYAERWPLSRYCQRHFNERIALMTPDQLKGFDKKFNEVLATLTYREREILKLRYGLGDGYVYTPAECGRIFKVTPQRVGQIEAKAIRKLMVPRRRHRSEVHPLL